MRTPALLVLSTALALSLSACGDDSPDEQQEASPLPESTSASATASAPAAAPAPAATTTAPPATPTSAAPATAAPTARPSFPKAVTAPVQGGTYFAVFLVTTRTTMADAKTKAAEAAAAKVGYTVAEGEVSTGEVDCTSGAREVLKLPRTGDYFATSIFFTTSAAAKQFVDAYEPGVVGTARVKAYCLD